VCRGVTGPKMAWGVLFWGQGEPAGLSKRWFFVLVCRGEVRGCRMSTVGEGGWGQQALGHSTGGRTGQNAL